MLPALAPPAPRLPPERLPPPLRAATLLAAGMLMAVLSLADGAYLPLGVDEGGKPVFAVYTDAQGEFEVHLPPGATKNVLVATPDPCRPRVIGDETSVGLFTLAVQSFGETLQSPAYAALGRDARERVLTRMTDLILANADVEGAVIQGQFGTHSTVTGNAMATIRRILDAITTRATPLLATRPGYFDDRPYMRVANLARGSRPAWRSNHAACCTSASAAATGFGASTSPSPTIRSRSSRAATTLV